MILPLSLYQARQIMFESHHQLSPCFHQFFSLRDDNLQRNPPPRPKAIAILEAVQKLCNEVQFEDNNENDLKLTPSPVLKTVKIFFGFRFKRNKISLPECHLGFAVNLLLNGNKIRSAILKISNPESKYQLFSSMLHG